MPRSSNVTFNFNLLRITVAPPLPKMVKIGPKLAPKYPFSSFLQIIFGIFAKIFFKTVQTFTIGHTLKFPAKNCFAGRGSQGVQNSPNGPKITIFSRFIPICWTISHKLPLNNMLKSRKFPLNFFFK